MEGGVTAIFEVGGHTAVQVTHRSTSTQHPARFLSGTGRVTWGFAFADSSFLDWVGFLLRRVLKLGSLL